MTFYSHFQNIPFFHLFFIIVSSHILPLLFKFMFIFVYILNFFIFIFNFFCKYMSLLIVHRTKNVPRYILAERFLLYRKAISCKARKKFSFPHGI